MPTDLFLRTINLDYFYPPFLDRLLHVKANALARGVKYLTTCGFRSWGESHQLYLKFLQGGPRAAPAGLSQHNYGLASDEALIIRELPKRVVRWNPEDFKILGEECKAAGLAWGIKGDLPHVGWPGFENAAQLNPLLKIWKDNLKLPLLDRLRKVWDYVDKNSSLPPLKVN